MLIITVTISDCNHLAHVIVFWQIQKFMCYYTVFAFFILNFRAVFKVQAPGALYLEGRFNRRFFAL